MPESMTPAEVIAAAVCSGSRFDGGPAPCEVCRGRAERDVAALVEGGYTITPAKTSTPVTGRVRAEQVIADVIDGVVCDHAPADVLSCTRCKADMAVIALAEQGYAVVPAMPSQALEATQGVESSGDGTRGHLGCADGSTALSALRRAEEAEEALEAAQQTIARVVAHALDQATYRPVEADCLAAVVLNLNPADLRPGAALTALTEENRRDA